MLILLKRVVYCAEWSIPNNFEEGEAHSVVLVFHLRHEKRNTERVGKPQYQIVDVQGVDLAFFREVVAQFSNASDYLSLTTKK